MATLNMSDRTSFEKTLREVLESQEMPYDPQAWDQLQQRMDASPGTVGTTRKNWLSWALGSAAVVSVVSVAVWLSPSENEDQAQQTPPAATEVKSEVPNTVSESPAVGSDQESTPEVQAEESMPSSEISNDIQAVDGAAQEGATTSRTNEEQLTTVDQSDSQDQVTETVREVNPTRSTPAASTGNRTIETNQEPEAVKPSTDQMALSAPETGICAGSSINLAVDQQSAANIHFELADGTRFTSNTVSFATPGSYHVQAVSEAGERSNSVEVHVHARPDARFRWTEHTTHGAKSSVSFEAVEQAQTTYIWHVPGEEAVRNGAHFERTFSKKGAYDVMLIAVNQQGCADTVIRPVYVTTDYNLLAPTAFSPNGDGTNDTWIPRALENCDCQFVLEVLDPANRVVYTTSSAAEPWDGRTRNGMSLDGETYRWRARVIQATNKVEEYSGSITITLFDR